MTAEAWYILRDEQRYGPVSEQEVRVLFRERQAHPQDMFWSSGTQQWMDTENTLVLRH